MKIFKAFYALALMMSVAANISHASAADTSKAACAGAAAKYSESEMNDLALRCLAFNNAVNVGEKVIKECANYAVQGFSQSDTIAAARRVIDFYHRHGGTSETFLKQDATSLKLENKTGSIDLLDLMGRALVVLHDHPAYGKEKIIPFIITLFKDVQAESWQNNNPKILELLDKIRGGSRDDAEKFLAQENIDVDTPFEMGMTPIFYAVLHGSQDMVGLLIDRKASINRQMKKGLIPLMVAPSEAMKQFLLKRGADINDKSSTGDTPLIYAARNRRHEMAKLVLDLNANVDVQGVGGQTALYCTVQNLDNVDANAIMRKGSFDSSDGDAPSYAIFKMLTQRNASCHIPDNNGVFPFMIAAEKGNINFFSIYFNLKRIPAQILNAPDNKGRVALSIASNMLTQQCKHDLRTPCHHKNLIPLLTRHGAHANGIAGRKPPIFMAIDAGDAEQIAVLFRCELDFNQRFDGKTIFEYMKEKLHGSKNKDMKQVLDQMGIAEGKIAQQKLKDDLEIKRLELKRQKDLQALQKKKEEEAAAQEKRKKTLAFKNARTLAQQKKREEEQKKIDEENAIRAKKEEEQRIEQEKIQAAAAHAAFIAQEQAALDKVKKEDDKKKAKAERRRLRDLEEKRALEEIENKRKFDEVKAFRAIAAKAAAKFVQELSDKAIKEYEKEIDLTALEKTFVQKSKKRSLKNALAQWRLQAQKQEALGDKALVFYGNNLAQDAFKTLKRAFNQRAQQKAKLKEQHDALAKIQGVELNLWTLDKAKIVLAHHREQELVPNHLNPLIEAQMAKSWKAGDYFRWFYNHLDTHLYDCAHNYLWDKEHCKSSRARATVSCTLCAPYIDTSALVANLDGLNSQNFKKAPSYELAAFKVKFDALKHKRIAIEALIEKQKQGLNTQAKAYNAQAVKTLA